MSVRTPTRPTPRQAPGPVPAAATDAAPRRVDALTGLRGLAAFGVFAFHVWAFSHAPDPAPGLPWLSATLDWLLRIGWTGAQ